MKSVHRLAAVAVVCAGLLAGCGNSASVFVPVTPPVTPVEPTAPAFGEPLIPVTEDRAGLVTNIILKSKLDGKDIPITLFEPLEMKRGMQLPLVLVGHGWGGSRSKARDYYTNGINPLGMYVITFDQRGFGESGGMVRAMDPEYDGQDLVQILDWAEELPGLARYADGRMRVGSMGSSYGGMFQYSLMGSDPKRRLRVIAPDVAPFDLNAALYPRGVLKSGWGAQLLAGLAPPLGKADPIVASIFGQGPVLGMLDESQQNFLAYHSFRYFCDGAPPGPQSFAVGTANTFTVPPGPLPKIDAFITQGFRDTLFNFNHAVDAYECLRKLGGDVRLSTHQAGHVFSQVSITNANGAEEGLDPAYAAITLPNSGDVAGNHQCGTVNSGDVTFAYFAEKLGGKVGAIDAATKTGRNICISLRQGDAIAVKAVKQGGKTYALPESTMQLTGPLAGGALVAGEPVREQLLATQIIDTVPTGGAIIAGIPTMELTLKDFQGAMPTYAVASAGCDPVLFVGIGWRKAGQTRFDLLDDQVMPLRGFGLHSGRMVGVAERLGEGDTLALLIYGQHPQYPLDFSRDALAPVVSLSGSVALPLLAPEEIVQDGGL